MNRDVINNLALEAVETSLAFMFSDDYTESAYCRALEFFSDLTDELIAILKSPTQTTKDIERARASVQLYKSLVELWRSMPPVETLLSERRQRETSTNEGSPQGEGSSKDLERSRDFSEVKEEPGRNPLT